MYKTSLRFFSTAIYYIFFCIPVFSSEHIPVVTITSDDDNTHFELASKYRFHKILASGSFGRVDLVSMETDAKEEFYARKMYKKLPSHPMAEIVSTLAFLKTLPPHPNIVSVHELYFHRFLDKTTPVVIMEYLSGEELFYVKVEELNLQYASSNRYELEKKIISRQIFSAISFLEENGISHLDIKSENFVFRHKKSTKLVLVDFDFLCMQGNQHFHYCGTPECFSPEMVKKRRGTSADWCALDQTKRDVWSAGLLLKELISGKIHYWKGKNEYENQNDLISVHTILLPASPFGMEPNLIELLTYTLKKNPDERWTATQALASPWFHIEPYEEPTEGIDIQLESHIGDVFNGNKNSIRVSPEATVSQLMDAIMLKFEIRKSAFSLAKLSRNEEEAKLKIVSEISPATLAQLEVKEGAIFHLVSKK